MVIASVVAAILAIGTAGWVSGPPLSWIDVAGEVPVFVFIGLLLVGVPVGLPVGLMLWLIDRGGPRYWRPVMRARWRLVLLSPATAAAPALVLAMGAAAVGACNPGSGFGATGPEWMKSNAAWWFGMAVLPSLYAVVWTTGFVRAWRLIPVVAGVSDVCAGCGYPRTGLPRLAACPECGRAAAITGAS